jgi:hypothetical protein
MPASITPVAARQVIVRVVTQFMAHQIPMDGNYSQIAWPLTELTTVTAVTFSRPKVGLGSKARITAAQY